MAHYIQTSENSPERLESALKTLLIPAANFVGMLTQGTATTVDLVGDDGVVYGTFTLDTINQPVSSGLLTALPRRMRFSVTSGTGKFVIEVHPGV